MTSGHWDSATGSFQFHVSRDSYGLKSWGLDLNKQTNKKKLLADYKGGRYALFNTGIKI